MPDTELSEEEKKNITLKGAKTISNIMIYFKISPLDTNTLNALIEAYRMGMTATIEQLQKT